VFRAFANSRAPPVSPTTVALCDRVSFVPSLPQACPASVSEGSLGCYRLAHRDCSLPKCGDGECPRQSRPKAILLKCACPARPRQQRRLRDDREDARRRHPAASPIERRLPFALPFREWHQPEVPKLHATKFPVYPFHFASTQNTAKYVRAVPATKTSVSR